MLWRMRVDTLGEKEMNYAERAEAVNDNDVEDEGMVDGSGTKDNPAPTVATNAPTVETSATPLMNTTPPLVRPVPPVATHAPPVERPAFASVSRKTADFLSAPLL